MRNTAPNRTPLELATIMHGWGNAPADIAAEADCCPDLVARLLSERDSSLASLPVARGLRRAYESLFPLSQVYLPAAPLRAHCGAILERAADDATTRKRVERVRADEWVSVAVADELLCMLGLHLELVYAGIEPRRRVGRGRMPLPEGVAA